jgi:hypothetical protein
MNGFQISPLLQELMVYFGQLECYEKCPEIIEKSVGVVVGHSQVHRVADTYGKELEKTIAKTRTLAPLKPDEVLYAQTDGSMLFTRDGGWKEVKVGRIFKSSDCIAPNEEQSWIRHSQYLAYLETSKTFTPKMEQIIESYGSIKQRLVFINDGATWIRQWIEDAYPDAISILDFWHALEYLYLFANSFFVDKAKAKKWAEKQKERLLASKVKQVIGDIKKLAPDNEQAKQVIAYYEVNTNRMDYKHYKTIGAGIIGSGAIESAHRTVVQKRMKLSGQRWSVEGAQNMLNLRVTYMNERWENVISLTKNNFKKQKLKPTG